MSKPQPKTASADVLAALGAQAQQVVVAGDTLLKRAFAENQTLSSKLAASVKDHDAAVSVARAITDKLATETLPGEDSPIFSAADKQAWYEAFDDPSRSKQAVASIAEAMTDRLLSVGAGPGSKTAAEAGELVPHDSLGIVSDGPGASRRRPSKLSAENEPLSVGF